MQILTLCISIAPFFLLVMGIFGALGMIQVGPRELPKKHLTNRKTAYTFLPLALGIYLLGNSNEVIFITGIILSIVALGFYGYFYREARKEFPEMTSEEWFKHLKTRYKFMNDSEPSNPGKKEQD